MSSNSSSSISPPRLPPHIRLNSAQEDLVTNEPYTSNPAAPSQPTSSRSLVPQRPTAPSLRTQSPLNGPQESAELLLPPSKLRTHRLRDEDSPIKSPGHSGFSSRRTSWSSDGGANPFGDSRSPSRADSEDDNVNTQTVSEKYNILPSAGLLLFPEDIEKDDYLHNPDPNEKDQRECDVFTRRGIVNVGGLALITLGLLILFIGYPVLTFVQKYTNPPDPCKVNPMCLNVGPRPLMKNIRHGLIDPDTPDSAMTKKNADGSTWKLVYSDEFNTDGRTFFHGDDPYLEAVDLWYGVTMDLEWYDPDAVTTKDGTLEIRFDAFQNHGLNYRSGMVQSWNQMCFKGGRMEASISLPGRGDTSGFWPGFWAMGNLGRPGHAATTDGLWPYSYWDECDAGITPNQSSTDGISFLPGMRLPACTCNGEDHPTPGKSRSAPEIDALEASVGYLGSGTGNAIGSVSQSVQMAPFDIWYQPDYDFIELYNPQLTMMNGYRGGFFQQAVSGLTNLNNDWYNGNAYQIYAFEYTPGADGDIVWFVGDEKTWKLDGRALGPNGNVGQRIIPEEPMSIILNFGMSPGFAPLNLTGLAPLLPATMRFDYVRIYQDPNHEMVSCDPPGYESTSYIAQHMDVYQNPNKTLWEQTPYSWPKNDFMQGCS